MKNILKLSFTLLVLTLTNQYFAQTSLGLRAGINYANVDNKVFDADGYEKLPSGEKERIQDKYITIVTTQKGWTSREFYNTDGKEINKLINKHL